MLLPSANGNTTNKQDKHFYYLPLEGVTIHIKQAVTLLHTLVVSHTLLRNETRQLKSS